jgi:ATP-dependent DNA helicase RecG
MIMENQRFEKKSLRLLKLDSNDHYKNSDSDHVIARHCVAFANIPDGGVMIIGIEDKEEFPPYNQLIKDEELPNKLRKRISEITQNVFVRIEIKKYSNQGEAVEIKIFPSKSTIASTSDGKYYIRSSDSSVAILPNELSRLFDDKPSFIWEIKKTVVPKERFDDDKLHVFISDIRASKKVSTHIKEKSDAEILEHYFFIDGDFLTNLGVLWIGSRKDRASLSYSPAVHFIKYDERGEKVHKITWDDYYLNPKELIGAILTQIPDWQEGVEIADGMFRKFIPNYSEIVIRELVTNALVHRPYTQRGEVLIYLHPDYLEIINPGFFPVGVTAQNFLHKSVRRNEKLAKVFSDLGLMEQEGSGIDKVYEILLSSGKQIPIALQGDDFVSIKIKRRILKPEIIGLMERANNEFELTQKQLISLGLIAENNSLSALELNNKLNLNSISQPNALKHWLGNLQDLDLIKSKGKTKAVEYFVNPEFLKKSNFKGKTNLKRIEGHKLKALINEDLSIYESCLIKEIHQRIGEEIPIRKVKLMLDKMILDKDLIKVGSTRWTKYSLNKNS